MACSASPRAARSIFATGSSSCANRRTDGFVHLYLFVRLESATLFIEEAKLTEDVKGYLHSIDIMWRDYNEN